MTTTTLWDEASRDFETEARERRLAMAKVSCAGFWPFLAAAESDEEYRLRLDIAQERIDAAVASVVGTEDAPAFLALREAVVASLTTDYAEHYEANVKPRTAARAERAPNGLVIIYFDESDGPARRGDNVVYETVEAAVDAGYGDVLAAAGIIDGKQARVGGKTSSVHHTAPGGGTHAPYRTEQRDGKWVVVNDNGEVKGTHDTEEEAREQQKALYANVPGAREQAEKKSSKTALPERRGLHCDSCNYTTDTEDHQVGDNCPNCGPDGDGGHLVYDNPLDKESSKASKTAGFPICAAGCTSTVSADDDLVNTFEGLAHRACADAWPNVAVRGKTADSDYRGGKHLRCGRCGHDWTTRNSYKMQCPQCGEDDNISWASQSAKTAAAPGDFTTSKTIEAVRAVLDTKTAQTIDGVLVDTRTADSILTVWGALNDENKAQFEAMPIDKMGSVASRLVGLTGSRRPFVREATKKTAVKVHTFDSTYDAYNESQVDDNIVDGDVLVVPSEGVYGFLYQAWPVAVVGERGEFHGVDEAGLLREHPEYQASFDAARAEAAKAGKTAAFDDQAYADAHEVAHTQGSRVLCSCGWGSNPDSDLPTGWKEYERHHAENVKTSAKTCPNCSGTGSVPAGGGEPEEDVDNGYVKCPTCGGEGSVGDDHKEAAASEFYLADDSGRVVAGPYLTHAEALVHKTAATKVVAYGGDEDPDGEPNAQPVPEEEQMPVAASLDSRFAALVTADYDYAMQQIVSLNGQPVSVRYNDDLGLRSVRGLLEDRGATVVVHQGNGVGLSIPKVHILSVESNGTASLADDGGSTVPVGNFAAPLLLTGPSGAFGAKEAGWKNEGSGIWSLITNVGEWVVYQTASTAAPARWIIESPSMVLVDGQPDSGLDRGYLYAKTADDAKRAAEELAAGQEVVADVKIVYEDATTNNPNYSPERQQRGPKKVRLASIANVRRTAASVSWENCKACGGSGTTGTSDCEKCEGSGRITKKSGKTAANPYLPSGNPYVTSGPGTQTGTEPKPSPNAGDSSATVPPADPAREPLTTRPRTQPSSPAPSQAPAGMTGPEMDGGGTASPQENNGTHMRQGFAVFDQAANRVVSMHTRLADAEALLDGDLIVVRASALPEDVRQREAKIAEITAAVVATNPGLDPKQARAVAEKTVERFPKVVA